MKKGISFLLGIFISLYMSQANVYGGTKSTDVDEYQRRLEVERKEEASRLNKEKEIEKKVTKKKIKRDFHQYKKTKQR